MATGEDITGPPRLPQMQSRAQEFGTGLSGAPEDSAGVSAMNADSERFNSLVPRQVGLSSVLQTAMPSMNGIGTSDQSRVLPTGVPGQSIMLPSQNGSSPDSWSKAIYMHMQGEDEI